MTSAQLWLSMTAAVCLISCGVGCTPGTPTTRAGVSPSTAAPARPATAPSDPAADRRALLRRLREMQDSCRFALAWDKAGASVLAVSLDPANFQNVFFHEVPVMPSVTDLDMRFSDANARAYKRLVSKFPNAQRIDLRGALDLSDEAIAALAALPALKKVAVGYPDDVEYQAEMAPSIARWKVLLGDRLAVDHSLSEVVLDVEHWRDSPSTELPAE